MLTAVCKADENQRANFRLKKVAKPDLKGLPAGSLLIRIEAASICGSDLFGRNTSTGREPISYLSFCCQAGRCGGTGHELVGTIVEVVEPCDTPVGRQVLAISPLYIQSMTSLRSIFQNKTGIDPTSVLPTDGGFAEYIVSHDSCCCVLPISDEVSPSIRNPLHYSAAQPLGTILHACSNMPDVFGKTVVVVGQGGNGLIMTNMLANMGARRIIVLDLNQQRLQVAKASYGATHTILVKHDDLTETIVSRVSDITEGELCDVSVEMVGHQGSTFNHCASLTRDGGTVVLFGLLAPSGLRIAPAHFVRNLRFVTCHGPSLEDFHMAVELIQQGRFDPAPLFSHTFHFRDFAAAYETASEYKDGVIKVLLTFGS